MNFLKKLLFSTLYGIGWTITFYIVICVVNFNFKLSEYNRGVLVGVFMFATFDFLSMQLRIKDEKK